MASPEDSNNPYLADIERIQSLSLGSKERLEEVEKWALRVPTVAHRYIPNEEYTKPLIAIGVAFLLVVGMASWMDPLYPKTGFPVVRIESPKSSPKAAANPESTKEQVEPLSKRVTQYMLNYIQHDNAGSLIDVTYKQYRVITLKGLSVKLHVESEDGIIPQDFPQKKFTRKIPSGGPGTGPSIKAGYWDYDVEGEATDTFIGVIDKTTGQIELWAVLQSNKGGFPDTVHPQPHLEFWRVFDSEDPKAPWFASFLSSGYKLSGEDLFFGSKRLPGNNWV